MEARAISKYIRSSPRKMRVVVNAVRGKRVAEALALLRQLPHRAARPVEKTIRSAIYNLIEKNPEERIDEANLLIREIRVDEGPRFKRYQPAPRGRAMPIRRRTSHLTVVVATAEATSEAQAASSHA
jgi:large subunit ribosomal protein L22